jgi:uncharacterized protein (DUF2235 family)
MATPELTSKEHAAPSQAAHRTPARGTHGPKNIVLCSDGTGNSGGKGCDTNVWRLYNAVDLHGHRRNPAIPRQVTFYDDGVGTQSFKLLRLAGGAFGWGLSHNIRDLYASLIKNYQSDPEDPEGGDKIFLFGFSRGAFTVRSLAGLICRCGIPDLSVTLDEARMREVLASASRFPWFGYLLYCATFFGMHIVRDVSDVSRARLLKAYVRAAFNRYREQHKKEKPWWVERIVALLLGRTAGYQRRLARDVTAEFKATYSHRHVEVHCVGVWDTVGALGAPVDEIREALDWLLCISFHKQDLHRNVRYGYQALAIDDERQTFHPVLWDEKSEGRDPSTIEQVWFCGAHSNVGGGYPKQGMAHVTLYWMMRNAKARGLCFQDGALEQAQRCANVNDRLYDARAGLGAYYRYCPRSIAELAKRYCHDGQAKIHASVFERIATGVQDYAPANLPPRFKVVDDDGTHTQAPWAAAVESYVASKHGLALELLERITQRWVFVRKVIYFAMLGCSGALVAGSIRLSQQRAPELAQTELARTLGVLSASLLPQKFHAAIAWTASGLTAAIDGLAKFLLPESAYGLTIGVLAYLTGHPLRLLGTALLLFVFALIRAWSEERTQEPYVEFWLELRRQLADRLSSSNLGFVSTPPQTSPSTSPASTAPHASKARAGTEIEAPDLVE